MNFPQIFNHPEFGEIRSFDLNGKPYFVGNDVARALEYIRPHEAVSSHCKGAVSYRILTNGGEQETKIVPEGDIYRLIVKASDQTRNPAIKMKAEKFESWIFDEVIPSIRRTGTYGVPTSLPDALRLAAEIEEKRVLLEQKIEADRPKVHFAESVEISKDSILVADLAKLLRQKGVDIGEIRLHKWMRENGYLIKSGSEYNKPTQRSMELGLFEIKTGHRGSSDGTIKLTHTSKVTGKGQIYFINKFLKAA